MTPAAVSALAPAALFAAIGLLAVCLLFCSCLLVLEIARGRTRRAHEAAAETVRAELHRAFVQFLAGSPDDAPIRACLETHRQQVAEMLLHFRGTVGGGARDRLCHLALDLGLVHEWCRGGASNDVARRRQAMARLAYICAYEPCRRVAGDLLTYALEDADEEVRLCAARGLVQTSIPSDVEDVFLLALGPNRLTRVVLAEELRRHAIMLLGGAVPEVLNSGQAEYIRGVLEILGAWERAIPLERLVPLLDHADREIRLLAFRLAPLAAPDEESRQAITRAMNDRDPEIRSLASAAATRLKLPGAPARVPPRGGA